MRKIVSKTVHCFLTMVLISGLSGCTAINSQVGGVLNLNTDVKIVLQALENVNPDENGRPSPVYIRLYQLKSDRAFANADFIELYEQDQTRLGDEYITKQELKPLKPGEKRAETFVLNDEAMFVGLFAEFNQFSNSQFKVVFPVTKNNVIRNEFSIEVIENQIIVTNK